jgi:serine/threonine-protein kinase
MGLEYDYVKVLDFGLVKLTDHSSAATRLTAAPEIMGTPAYMAPEVILGDAAIDDRLDIYAVGCVAYYLLTGELVFAAPTKMKMVLRHVQEPPIPPSLRTRRKIPKELDDLVLACLQKDPRRRPGAEEMLQRLATIWALEQWDQRAAKAWWEKNLPELTRPSPVTIPRTDANARALAASLA